MTSNRQYYSYASSARHHASRCILSLTIAVCLPLFAGCSGNDTGASALKSDLNFSDPHTAKNPGVNGIYEDRWMGKEASITLINPRHERTLLLEGTNVQTKLPDEKMRLTVLCQAETVHVASIAALGEFREIIVLPLSLSTLDTLKLFLVSSKAFVPSKLGTSNDNRVLSFRVRRIALIAPEETGLAMPMSFRFPRSSESDPNLAGVYSDGWMGDSATIVLFNLRRKENLEIRGTIPGNIFTRIADLEIYAGQKLLAKQQFSTKRGGSFRISLVLPEDLVLMEKILITLKPSYSFVPAERGINTDRRRLSYRLEYIGLE